MSSFINRTKCLLSKKNKFLKKFLIALIGITLSFQIIASVFSLYFDRDEVRKLLRTAGYTEEQFVQLTYNSKIISVNEIIQQYQLPCVYCAKKPTLSALLSSKEHPPLYYIALQKWLSTIGHKINPKFFSVLTAIATVPAIYWLAFEISHDCTSSLISTTLFALSPYQFSIAQHVSQYALWGLLVCLSTSVLLRANRSQKKLKPIAIYTVINVLGLYTHLFYILLIFSHLAYLALSRSWKIFKFQVISAGISLVFLTPWILGILANIKQFKETSRLDVETVNLDSGNIISNLLHASTFLSQAFWRQSNISIINDDFIHQSGVIIISIFTLMVLSYFLFRKTHSVKTSILILLSLYFTSLPLVILGDVLNHALASKMRYYWPTMIFVFVGFGFLIGNQLKQAKKKKYVGVALLALIVLLSFTSTSNLFGKVILNSSQGVQIGLGYERAASTINVTEKPLLISREEHVKVLMLSHRLKPTTDLILVGSSENFGEVIAAQKNRYKGQYSDIFIFSPSRNIKDTLNQFAIPSTRIPSQWDRPVLYQLTPDPK